MRRRNPLTIVLVAALVATAASSALAHNEGLPSVPVSINKMEHVFNAPSLSGNNFDVFERKLADGTLARYVVASNQGAGFDILDITDPTHPRTVGRYVGPGLNYHSWVSVNPRRNIVALTVEGPAVTLRHNGAAGIQFVDISNVTNPVPLGKLDGLDGPHTVRMIGNNHAYTSLNTYVVDYTDPMNPTMERAGGDIEGHEFYEDPNHPGRGYVGRATSAGRWAIMDLANPGKPTAPIQVPDSKIQNAHEVYPSPDSSFVGVADFKSGISTLDCPGGGVHFYDISGKYVPGASLANPRKMGTWFAPFTGLSTNPASSDPNYASCTMHSWYMHPERLLAIGGIYAGGTWVFDPSRATQTGGDYTEFDGGTARGKTTWGTTLANVRDAGDFVNAAQFLPFDLADPEQERLIFVNGMDRGLDVYRYTGPLPKKLSRLQVNATGAGGVVTGALDRYAVLTYEGWKNLPLAGRTLTVTSGAHTVEVETAADGSFSAALGLGAGVHSVTVTWAGDDRFQENSITRNITF